MDLLRIIIGHLLDEAASRFPESEAFIDVPKGESYPYREFLRMVIQLAKEFLRLGLRKGEHLTFRESNRSEWIISNLLGLSIFLV